VNTVNNPRTYGKTPYSVAVIHGGPGAPGEMGPVARELAADWGVLEPLQTASSLEAQVDELKTILEKNGDLPVILIGWSWGAWLSFIVSARYPLLVKKLLLISSGPFEEEYAENIMKTRLSRLTQKERAEVMSLVKTLNIAATKDKTTAMVRFGTLISEADAYHLIPHDNEIIEADYHIYQSVWHDAEKLRQSGELLELGKNIKCPVVAIHGDYDPHPAAGVQKPLSRVLENFRFILLKYCGHTPWLEREARDKFYEILKHELNT
jgi:pimeloyl-ACP methyl ester carboxylesterase